MVHDRRRLSWRRTAASRRRTAARMRPYRRSMASVRKYWQVVRQSRPCWMRSNRTAIFATFPSSRSDIERVGGEMGKIFVPVLSDLQPRRHPDALMLHDIVEKPHQRGRAPGTSGDAAVQAHRHHLGRGLAFGVQHVETVLQIREKLIAAAKSLRVDKTHVVGIETVANNQMGPGASRG